MAPEKVTKKVLIVDDTEDNREILVYRLGSFGDLEVLTASNGKEALEVARQFRPDLIIMDLKMPVMSGAEATRALKQTEWGKQIPVIALTAHVGDAERNMALDAGCSDFVTKPIVDYEGFYKRIQKFLK